MKGEAEAYAIEAKAKAEAEQMARKADAWKDYQEAAMVDMVLETIPKVHHCSSSLYETILRHVLYYTENSRVKLLGKNIWNYSSIPLIFTNIFECRLPPRLLHHFRKRKR